MTLDLGHNSLVKVPEDLIQAKNLIVLSLSHNKISSMPGAVSCVCVCVEGRGGGIGSVGVCVVCIFTYASIFVVHLSVSSCLFTARDYSTSISAIMNFVSGINF